MNDVYIRFTGQFSLRNGGEQRYGQCPSEVRSSMQVDSGRPRSGILTQQEAAWIDEILQANMEWKNADVAGTCVVARAHEDEGMVLQLESPERQNPKLLFESGYIGRVVITTTDGSLIEVRLDHQNGKLHELHFPHWRGRSRVGTCQQPIE